MKNLRISLDAARLIALTAMLGFVDGRNRLPDSDLFRSRVALVKTPENTDLSKGVMATEQPKRTAYLIEFQRGSRIHEVLVDAFTGRVLTS
jgi:hypothetical protein